MEILYLLKAFSEAMIFMPAYVLDLSFFQGYDPHRLQLVFSFQTWLTVLTACSDYYYFFFFFFLILRGVDILSRFYQIYERFSQQSEEIKICSE